MSYLNEIFENEFNLNLPRYVDTFEEEDKIDIEKVVLRLKELDKELDKSNKKIESFCEILNISKPF